MSWYNDVKQRFAPAAGTVTLAPVQQQPGSVTQLHPPSALRDQLMGQRRWFDPHV